MSAPYFDLFESAEDVVAQFTAPADALEGATVHLAWYAYEDYSGSAFVLYEKDGKLYEVNGGHCSCNGLEGQWEPEETTWEAIAHRLRKGSQFHAMGAAESLTPIVDARVPRPAPGETEETNG